VTYALLQFNNDPTDWKVMLEATERANAEGLRIHPQTLARPAGAVSIIEGYHPFMLRPSYLEIGICRCPSVWRPCATPSGARPSCARRTSK